VERRQVNREISPEEVGRLKDQTIEVTETAEEPVVAKRARVREEVVVGRDATSRMETVRDNVRRTEVEVEQLEGKTVAASEAPGRRHAGKRNHGGGPAGNRQVPERTGSERAVRVWEHGRTGQHWRAR